MKYELELFENLIHQLSTNSEEVKLQEEELKELLTNEKVRIKRSLVNEAFGLKKEKYVALFIRKHQRALIRMLDELLNSPKIRAVDGIEIVYQSLEEILSFIETYFSKHFNLDQSVPGKYCLVARQEFKNKLRILAFPADSAPGSELAAIAVYPIEKFTGNEKSISFRSLAYLRELMKPIRKILERSSGSIDIRALRRSLIYLNFNSYRFFKYLTYEINAAFQEKETFAEQIEYLSLQLKITNQTHVKPGLSYKPGQMSIKNQLNYWILEELAFVEKKRQLLLLPAKRQDAVIEDFRILTDLSVQQLAYFTKLLVDTKVIKNRNLAELIRFISANTSTKRTERISHESFRTKYYNIEDSAKEFVKDLIIRLLNEARKP